MDKPLKNVLEIKNLSVEYHTDFGVTHAIDKINLKIKRGQAMGLVGESGSGKTSTALSILRLLPRPAGIKTNGEIYFNEQLLDSINEKKMQKLRGNRMSMIFQNPLTSLNPVFTVGEQISVVFQNHYKMGKRESLVRAGEMLEVVGIPRNRILDYPHQFSGGMRQRVGIAMGLACNPELLIADEPTTALDVTIQLQIIELIKELQKKYETSLLMITHNLGIISELCSVVSVMYAGTIVEYGTVREVFMNPQHPYTIGLLNSLPKIVGERNKLTAIAGSAANANNLPEGCKFYPRCPHCMEQCKKDFPPFIHLSQSHSAACYLYEDKSGGKINE